MSDSTLALLTQGYAWLPNRLRGTGGAPVRTRLMGRRAIALHGPEAVRFFYDERHIRRHGAIPGPVLDTLFGRGAVHTLDGDAHRVRKALFLALLKDGRSVAALADHAAEEFDRACTAWAGRPQVVLFDEVSLVITRAVCAWAGVRLTGDEAPIAAQDLVAMVDGFASPGLRHVRARRARRRQETRLAGLITGLRTEGHDRKPDEPGTAIEAVAEHRDADGEFLDPHTAAVEVLNIIRPAVAVTWFTVFAAHALHRWPEHRKPLAAGDEAYARAFAHEVRRFYPFAPFVGGRAADTLQWRGERIEPGTLVLLDLYGQNHDPDLWPEPYTFDPGRFNGVEPGRDRLIPQGGGEAGEGHRCPGEDITITLLTALAPRLARLRYEVTDQDLTIPLRRVPTRPRSGFVIAGIRDSGRSDDSH